LPIAKALEGKARLPSVSLDKIDSSNAIMIGDKPNSHTPSLLTFEVFNKNFHNCLVDSGAPLNIMPYLVCLNLNITPEKFVVQIVQLDRRKVKIL